MSNYADANVQAGMVLDKVRTCAYDRAIGQVIRHGDVVLDLGSGTGLLSLLAAKHGAKRVYAVECTKATHYIQSHIEENGFQDVIQVVHANIEDLDESMIKSPPRVIIGELLGNFAPAEYQHPLYQKARKLSMPDAVVIPASYRMVYAAANPRYLQHNADALDSLHGISMRSLAGHIRSTVVYSRLEKEELCSPEVEGEEIKITDDTPVNFTASIPITKEGPVSAVVVSFITTLVPGIQIDTSVGKNDTHWKNTVFPLPVPLFCQIGDVLNIRILTPVITETTTWKWEANHIRMAYNQAHQAL